MAISKMNGVDITTSTKIVGASREKILGIDITGGASGGVPVIESFEISAIGFNNTASCTVNKPTGVATNDLLLILASAEEDGNSTHFNELTGFTKAFEYGDSDPDTRISAYWRIATGSESASETLTTAAVCFGKLWYLRISGANTTTPIHLIGTPNSVASATSLPALSITTTVDNCLVIAIVSFDGGDGFPFTVSGTDWPSSFLTDQSTTDGTFAGAWSGAWTSRDKLTAGATNDITFGASVNDGLTTVQFAIQP